MKIKYLVACLSFFSLYANAAEPYTYTQESSDLYVDPLQALEILNKAQSEPITKYVDEAFGTSKPNPYLDDARAISKRAGERINTIFSQQDNQKQEITIGDADFNKAQFDTLVFASFSLDEKTLKQMYKACAGSNRTTIVFRGLPPGCRTINDAIVKIQQIALKLNLKNPPNAVLNPIWFQKYNITKVPTILALKDLTDKQSGDNKTGITRDVPEIKASVQGLIDPAWLYERIKEGQSGDLGIQAATFDIIEKDLIEEMKDRAKNINWEEKRANALKRMWQNIPITDLAQCYKYKKRLIDPTITVKRDVKTPDGKFIARKGERINPLERKLFTRLIVAFDPTNAKEVDFIEQNLEHFIKKVGLSYSDIRFMMTNYDRDSHMAMYQDLTKRFKAPMYVLTPDIKETFLLESHPSIVYSQDLSFAVEEFDIRESLNDQMIINKVTDNE